MTITVWTTKDKEFPIKQNLPAFENVPHEYYEILTEIQQYFPGALIAGGCLRDHILGRPPNDVDVFISAEAEGYNTDPSLSQLDMLLARDGISMRKFDPIQGDLAAYALNFTDVKRVWNSRYRWYDEVARSDYTDGNPMVQLIILQGPVTLESLAERCDFGICRISYDGTKLFMHNDFIFDVQRKLFTLRKNSYINSHYMRWNRFKDRFEGYELNSPEIDQYIKELTIDWSDADEGHLG